MAGTRVRTVGSVSLGLSLLTFSIYFLNVLLGGPLGRKPWLSDVMEMLTLFLAVGFFVAGTVAREAEAKLPSEGPEGQDGTGDRA